MSLSGKCVCGAVSYTVSGSHEHIGACHCSMCRRWSGGVFLGLKAAADQVTISGAENLTTYTSSDWAERAFCKTCGANLYYRVTAEGPHAGDYHLGVGTLDDAAGLALNEQLFIDLKPGGYTFEEDTHSLTQAQVLEMFGDAP